MHHVSLWIVELTPEEASEAGTVRFRPSGHDEGFERVAAKLLEELVDGKDDAEHVGPSTPTLKWVEAGLKDGYKLVIGASGAVPLFDALSARMLSELETASTNDGSPMKDSRNMSAMAADMVVTESARACSYY